MNNGFINRNRDLAALEGLFSTVSERGRLGVVYGRRRLGKTTLLRRFASDHPHCCYVADRAGPIDARRSLADLISVQLREPTLGSVDYANWYALFAAYDRLRKADEPHLLVLDEYQYLCEADPAFSTYLQKWWDEHWRRQRLMVVLCGSVTSMMYKETLAASSPLYGRADLKLLLEPLRFSSLKDFLPDTDWRRRSWSPVES